MVSLLLLLQVRILGNRNVCAGPVVAHAGRLYSIAGCAAFARAVLREYLMLPSGKLNGQDEDSAFSGMPLHNSASFGQKCFWGSLADKGTRSSAEESLLVLRDRLDVLSNASGELCSGNTVQS